MVKSFVPQTEWALIGMTLAETARALRVNPRTVAELIRDKGLPARKVAGQWRVSPNALDKWLAGPEEGNQEEENIEDEE